MTAGSASKPPQADTTDLDADNLGRFLRGQRASSTR